MNIVMSVHLRASVNDLRIVNAAFIVVKIMKIMSVVIVALRLALIAILIKTDKVIIKLMAQLTKIKKRIRTILIAVTTIVTILDLISLPKNLGHKPTLIVQDATKHLVIKPSQIQVLINLVVSLAQRQLKRSFLPSDKIKKPSADLVNFNSLTQNTLKDMF